MKSNLTEDFLDHFEKLPEEIKMQARNKYRLWKRNPYHPGLNFKRIHSIQPVYSIRIGRGWRALGLMLDDTVTWFWIGSHADYDRLVSKNM